MFETIVLLAVVATVLIAFFSRRFQVLLVTIMVGAISHNLGNVLASPLVKGPLNELVALVWKATVAIACVLHMLPECANCDTLCGFQIWRFPL
jgi:hypothetical protein